MIHQQFTISLRVRHPVYSARYIVESLGLAPEVAHGVGAQRTTPTGRRLDGSYNETYCVFSLTNHQAGYFVEGVTALLPTLKTYREFLKAVADSGGSSELYVGVFLNGSDSVGFILDTVIMSALSDLHLNLAGELYWK